MLGDEIATYLAGAGLGLSLSSTSGGIVFGVPFPPEAPDTACCVIEYGGGPPLDAFGASLSAPVYEQPRFQVLCRDRSDNAATCRALANSIYKALRHFSGTIGGVSYGFIQAVQPVAFLKFDENNRPYYYSEFDCRKQESP